MVRRIKHYYRSPSLEAWVEKLKKIVSLRKTVEEGPTLETGFSGIDSRRLFQRDSLEVSPIREVHPDEAPLMPASRAPCPGTGSSRLADFFFLSLRARR